MTQVAAETPALPAIGQVVTVRNRPWVVADVRQGSVAGSDDRALTSRAPHVVSLVSIEDDARDERLRVVWELEPGAAAYEQHALPSPARGFDPPGHLDAFLDAVRWGAIASADTTVLQAPFRSGIQIEEYQLDPVVRALSMPRTNLLIADDVGLGKTIEAGLVMQELMLRHRARTMLIVCPAGLTLQWRDEMRDKFGLDFRIVDSGLLKELRRTRGLYANPWTHFPRLIVSVDWLKRDRPRRLLRDVLPRFRVTRAPSTCWSWTRCTPARRRPGGSTRSTRSGPRSSVSSHRTASTGCSCPPPRTTATRTRGPPCWSCWTTSDSRGVSRPATSSSPR